MFSCWAAHAALYHHYGINRHLRKDKLSGVFQHTVNDSKEELTRGFDEYFTVPHSRFGYINKADYESVDGLKVIAESPQAGVYLVASANKQQVYLTGHPEYDVNTLHDEYLRDQEANANADMPCNYYPNDNENSQPINSWRSHGSLLFTNWLNYYVYQITPYKLDADNIQAMQTSQSGASLEK